ncbi:hypothetical protein PACTADRAFT_73337 [Pachysolen tannophilus NRRL Y-2460]|uniref:Uncharacterized protein n=1 Tax=Pachysolen tannophilus NRRL Y-2460 TaxID=669874 RepID=A0A1E4U0V1_PACTA|nr:hypothetical protein PACTADRAFT_73337 [Pachysolen tannophilus NRRL Y-2460]
MPSGYDRTRIIKTPIAPIKASRVSNNIWSKVKTTASNSAFAATSKMTTTTTTATTATGQSANNGGNSYGMSPPNSSASALSSVTPNTVIEFGPNGEVIISYGNNVEIWDWFPSPLDDTTRLTDSGGTLYLVASVNGIDGIVSTLCLLKANRKRSNYTSLVGYVKKNEDYFQIIDFTQNKPATKRNLSLLPSTIGSGPYTCKVLEDYFVISTSEGSLSIFNLKDYSPLTHLELNCKVINNNPVYDVQENWLVYSPSTIDGNYQQIISNDYLGHKEENNADNRIHNGIPEHLKITPLNLPKPGPLLNRLLKNLSSTAIDGVFKFTEVSQSRLKQYLNTSQQQQIHAAQQNDGKLYATSSTNLKETITRILNPLNGTSSRQFLILVSLEIGKPLFVFSPPGGCSHVSLSPYDLLLSTTTLRGDDIFIWNYTKFNKQIVLVDKFKRGNTPGIVDQVFWCEKNKAVGVISRLSGSLHLFKTDFEGLDSDIGNSRDGSWVLSNCGLKKITTGYEVAQLNASSPSSVLDDSRSEFLKNIQDLKEKLTKSCLFAIDNKNNLKVISLMEGLIHCKYELPTSPVPLTLLPRYLLPKDESNKLNDHGKAGNPTIKKPAFHNLLSDISTEVCPSKYGALQRSKALNSLDQTDSLANMIELEYNLPYEFLYKKKQIEFYGTNNMKKTLDDWILGNYDETEDLIKVDFGKANGAAVFHDNMELINKMINEDDE